MHEQIYPFTFEPVFRDYIWGGRSLETILGRDLPTGAVAESWEISGHPSSPTRALAGYWRGKSLPEIQRALGFDLIGTNSAEMLRREKFPLLVKLLDANLNLSVQVHPDDGYAGIHEGGELGKAEMWYVIHAKPDAELIYGLNPGCTKSTFRRALETGELESQLYRLPVRAGDCIDVLPGTIHALLAGVLVVEIQQSSDTTYRVYDWGRLGLDGRPRSLHIAESLEVINWQMAAPQAVTPQALSTCTGVAQSLLVDNGKFRVEQLDLTDEGTYVGQCDGTTFEVWGCVTGSCAIRWSESSTLGMKSVGFMLLPATLGRFEIATETGCRLLRAYVGRPDSR